MGSLAGNVGIDDAGHAYYTANGIIYGRGLANHDGGVLTASWCVGWYSDGEWYLSSGIRRDGASRSI